MDSLMQTYPDIERLFSDDDVALQNRETVLFESSLKMATSRFIWISYSGNNNISICPL